MSRQTHIQISDFDSNIPLHSPESRLKPQLAIASLLILVPNSKTISQTKGFMQIPYLFKNVNLEKLLISYLEKFGSLENV